jgi:viologen exporter family transport system permease protein
VKGLLDIYAQQFRITLASFVQYRASIFIYMLWHVLEPVIYLVVWSTVSRSRQGSVGGYGTGDFVAYFIAVMVVNHLTYTWVFYEFDYRIRHGSLSLALLRPLHPIHTDIVDNLSSKLITLPMMLAAAVLLGLLFGPTLRWVPWSLAAFVPALALAVLLRFLVEWTLALAAFWTTRMSAVIQGYYMLLLFLSGQMAPLALLPQPVQRVASALPFRWMVSFPVELALGRLTPAQALAGLGMQAVWLAASALVLRSVWRAGLRIYSAVGA